MTRSALPAGFPAVLTLDEQSRWAYHQLESQPADITRKLFLELLHDRNETLYFKVLSDHLAELLPVLDGQAAGETARGRTRTSTATRAGFTCRSTSPGDVEKSFATLGLSAGDVNVVVCSDAGQIPGIGDGGGGGVRAATGTAAIYTAAAGIHPGRVIPVALDSGTDNETLRSDPFYLGNRHAKRRGPEYDAFIDHYVQAVSAQFPRALLHFAGFSTHNAQKILQAYGHDYRVFSDQVQGTGAAVLAAVYAAIRITGIPIKHQELVVCGAGADGIAIADHLRAAMTGDGATDEQARSQIWVAGGTGSCSTTRRICATSSGTTPSSAPPRPGRLCRAPWGWPRPSRA